MPTTLVRNPAAPKPRHRSVLDDHLSSFRRTLISSAPSEASGGMSDAEAETTAIKAMGAIARELAAMDEAGEYTPQVRASAFETCGPFSLLSYIGRRAITRPRGYSGDYKSIDHIYANEPKGACRIGRGIDRYVLETPAAQDVRHRRDFLAAQIRAVMAGQDEARITSVASGPARELGDALEGSEPIAQVTCLDIDAGSLDHARRNLRRARADANVRCVRANVTKLEREFAGADLGSQDLIYSAGLIDYFTDRLVVGLLNSLHRLLRSGGRVIVGNFCPTNPDRQSMEALMDWPLTHRSAANLEELFARSAFGSGSVRIHRLTAGVQLFAEAQKT